MTSRYSPEARWANIRAVEAAIRRACKPLIISEIASYAAMNHETATTVVRAAVRLGILRVWPVMRRTRTGPAKQYALRRRPKDLAATPRHVLPPIIVSDPMAKVCAAIDGYWDWVAHGQQPVPATDGALYAAVEAALRAMPATQAIAVAHVHRCAVWNFRRLDLQEVYREALDRLALRLAPLVEQMLTKEETTA